MADLRTPPSRPGKQRRRERGQSLVEFALVLPLFLVIVMAIADFGWGFRDYMTVTNSAREGARLGITGSSSTDIKAKTTSTSAGLLSTGDVTVTNAQGSSGTNLVVAVAYTYNFVTPIGSMIHFLTGGTFPSSVPLAATTTMRIE